jgi:hypothetical protein
MLPRNSSELCVVLGEPAPLPWAKYGRNYAAKLAKEDRCSQFVSLNGVLDGNGPYG